ncbi:hypothetical protein CPB84DRAFT_1852065 [Gymnopilus junonius]|uniref:Uncharacterized protein n=1 Tax=Gymnopilus junonius TaxID=109634 RepID=A0A9P5NB33_GYMJU|nr:hypothetical protein CPB84DRAFT_1852065 [Gymnopilus junonius]
MLAHVLGHSFRIGGAVELLLVGIPPEIVAATGSWTSLTFLLYWHHMEEILPMSISKAYNKTHFNNLATIFKQFRINHKLTPPASEAKHAADDDEDPTPVPPHMKPLRKHECTAQRTTMDSVTPLFLPTATSPLTSPLWLSQSSPHDATLPATMPTSVRFQDSVGMELEQLESLLDSVMATLVIIQSCSTSPAPYSLHCQEALAIITKLLISGSLPTIVEATLPNPPPCLI